MHYLPLPVFALPAGHFSFSSRSCGSVFCVTRYLRIQLARSDGPSHGECWALRKKSRGTGSHRDPARYGASQRIGGRQYTGVGGWLNLLGRL